MTILYCPACGEPCGKEYPSTHTDPKFREGKGEQFVLPDGRWCCSQTCLDSDEFKDYEQCDRCLHDVRDCVCKL